MNTSIIVLIIALSTGLPLLIVGVVFYHLLVKPARETKRIKSIGVPATAVILGLRYTGVRVNRTPIVEIELQVTTQEGAEYVAKVKARVAYSQTGQYATGTKVDVLFDPQNIQKLIITKVREDGE